MTIFEALEGPGDLIVFSDMSGQLLLNSLVTMCAYETVKMSFYFFFLIKKNIYIL